MKKVLIITDLVHATPRIPSLAKYLPEFGWQPIILTTSSYLQHNIDINVEQLLKQNQVIVVIYHDYLNHFLKIIKKISGFHPQKSIRKQADKQFGINSPRTSIIRVLLKIIKEIFYYPDQFRMWKAPAIKVADNLLRKESIDAVISSSSPVTSHIIARKLKDKHKFPWIVDLRDLWSQNHNYPYGSVRHMLDRRLELNTLSTAELLITVSKPLEKKLRKLHIGKTVYTVTNGFDPDDISSANRDNLTSKFIISYTGQIYYEKQDPSKLLRPLQELIAEGKIDQNDIEVRFYGYEEVWLEKEIVKYGLSNIVKQLGWIPRKVVFEKQRESHILLLLNFEDKNEQGTYTSKIFEYLAAKRPILITGGFDGDIKINLIKKTNSGFYTKDVQEVKDVIEKIYLEYKEKGEISYYGNEEEINKYSHREMARNFAKCLDLIV